MSSYKCCECGSDLGLKSTTEIACPECEGFDLKEVYRKPLRPDSELGDVWTTDPPKELGWYKVILGNDNKSMACVTSVDSSGDVVWATVGPLNQLHIGVSSRVHGNQMVNFWGEKVL